MHGRWINNYLCNQCLPPLTLWVRIPLRRCVLDTTLCDKVCQWLASGRWFSPGTPVSSTNKTDCHDKNNILLKVALNTIKQTTLNQMKPYMRESNSLIFWYNRSVKVEIIPGCYYRSRFNSEEEITRNQKILSLSLHKQICISVVVLNSDITTGGKKDNFVKIFNLSMSLIKSW